MEQNAKNKIASIIYAVAFFFFIITFSIGLPIYFRPFYYWHIEPLELEQISGFTAVQIKQAYNEMLDFLTLPFQSFSLGEIKFSESGAAHFADCKALFTLNAVVLLGSFLVIILMLALKKKNKLDKLRIGKLPCEFFAANAVFIIGAVIAVIVASDFNKAFAVFHKVFFAGKTNWLFDDRTDPIINVLPKEFFANSALLIVASMFVFWLVGFIKYVKEKKA